jgi:hypothetical protein
MDNDTIMCSTLFCPLSEMCRRKHFVGKPFDPNQPFGDFGSSLKYDKETDEWCCEMGIEVECK